MSYVNVVMLSMVIQNYEKEDEKDSKADKVDKIDFGNDVQSLANYMNNIPF